MNSNWQRYQEKRDIVIRWLLEFRTSTPRILASVLGLQRAGMGAFFKSLKRDNIIETVKAPGISENLFFLGKHGQLVGGTLSEYAEDYSVTKTSAISGLCQHHLSVQVAVLSRVSVTVPFGFQSEWHLSLPSNARPDAIVTKGKILTALEVELTQKTIPRIFLAFLTHLDHMREGHYHKVEYVFANAALLARYEQKFQQTTWPMYTRTSHGHLVPVVDQHKRQKMANADDPIIRERFTFTHEELYQ